VLGILTIAPFSANGVLRCRVGPFDFVFRVATGDEAPGLFVYRALPLIASFLMFAALARCENCFGGACGAEEAKAGNFKIRATPERNHFTRLAALTVLDKKLQRFPSGIRRLARLTWSLSAVEPSFRIISNRVAP